METLVFRFENGTRKLDSAAQLVGVVSSGNLEVLVNQTDLQSACEIEVNTAAIGFAAIWEAVMKDFHARWQLADVRIAINDMGATPAVVSLRLDQAIESSLEASLEAKK
ncbi:malonate decarboxylase acyl carrier protein [Undibacterium jejuense]|uniref:Malonate decarboxylase acyl carrier protein n=1 Tax=Undibacterium jejuense TaxID=1344949 RepID=A0A923HSJ7_9BURK|nr:malonate decarboxylase acyl carrier protein [Undibacterium jejuense]MBC3863948.1 malonate decarboxylase acyl carrier protein [Undibacterium jejuense]